MSDWRPIKDAPRDGSRIWAWLNHSGIRSVRWSSAEEACEKDGGIDPREYIAGWVELADETELWSPEWWKPHDEIGAPPT